ncbi:MAG: SDR family NAD(P)-dependent oxidoreductase, partial [Paracoccaceae bacterium]
MDMTGNTILITGGGSGIGRGLAEAFQGLGNKVIIAGRRADVLAEVVAANPGMASVVFDVEDAAGIPAFVAKVVAAHSGLNV